jgi:hypothetical protein
LASKSYEATLSVDLGRFSAKWAWKQFGGGIHKVVSAAGFSPAWPRALAAA